MNKTHKTIEKIKQGNVIETTFENGAVFLTCEISLVAAYIPWLGFIESSSAFLDDRPDVKESIERWKERNGNPLVARVPPGEIKKMFLLLDRAKDKSRS